MRPALLASYVLGCAGAAVAVAMLLPVSQATGQVTSARVERAAETATPAPATLPTATLPTAIPAVAVDGAVNRQAREQTVASGRAPVPLLRTAPIAPPGRVFATTAAVTDAISGDVTAAPAPPVDDKQAERAAKASIEADGYKKVRILRRDIDGKWIGKAFRGDTEVAVTVDDQGSVSLQ